MNKTMFILEFDFVNNEGELPNFPEVTLWKTFNEAWDIALKFASKLGIVVDMGEAIVNPDEGVLFIPGFCEIMPIKLSTHKKVTWFGKKWTEREEKTVEDVTNE